MILIIGGAYQGKLAFAKDAFQLEDADVYTCSAGKIDFSKRCVYALEEFTWGHPDPAAYFREQRDVFCGVVPMDPETRLWRQKTGRLSQYLSKEADQVSRIFCGLEQRLK